MGFFGFGKKKNTQPAEDKKTITEQEAAQIDAQAQIEEKLQNETSEAAADTIEEIEVNGEGHYNFARMYEDQKNYSKAFESYFQAAEAGYVPAQYTLGTLYERGRYTETNKEAAIMWYTKAAEQGHPAAQFNLGYMYYNGEGCTKNTGEAVKWMKLAADQGDEAASEFLESIKAIQSQQAAKRKATADLRFYLTEFLKSDKLYVIYSSLTKAPYIVYNEKTKDNDVYCYRKENQAFEKVSELNSDDRGVQVRVVEKKDYPTVFGRMYAYGINGVMIDKDYDEMHVYLYQLFKRKDFSKLPANKRPVENPLYSLSILKLLQEARRKTDKKDEQLIKRLNLEMTQKMFQAQFLIPVMQVEQNGKKLQNIVLMKNNVSGVNFIPAFTDLAEFSDFRKNQKFGVIGMPFLSMATLEIPETVTEVVLNPSGACLPLKRDLMKKVAQSMMERAKAANTGAQAEAAPAGQNKTE